LEIGKKLRENYSSNANCSGNDNSDSFTHGFQPPFVGLDVAIPLYHGRGLFINASQKEVAA
jgi:hypothetical protein